jgi:hypothetical protein
LRVEGYHLFGKFLEEPTKDSEIFGRNRQIQCFSTTRGRVTSCQLRKLSPIQCEISHRKRDPREMLLLSAGQLFQNVGNIEASIYRIASGVNASKGSFYNRSCRISPIFVVFLSEHGHMALPRYEVGK